MHLGRFIKQKIDIKLGSMLLQTLFSLNIIMVYINPETGVSNDPYDNDGIFSVYAPAPRPSEGSLKIMKHKEAKRLEAARALIKQLDSSEEYLNTDRVVRALKKAKFGEITGRYEMPDGTPAASVLNYDARYVSRSVNPDALEDAREELAAELARKMIGEKSK